MFFVHVNASNQLKRLLLSAIELIYTVHSQSLLFCLVILELQQFILQLQLYGFNLSCLLLGCASETV